MALLQVSVRKLNKRSSVPFSLSDKNIIGAVFQGFRFEGEAVENVPNPDLGKWYADRDNHFYWSGGLIVLGESTLTKTGKITLPINLPVDYRVGIDISHHNVVKDWTAFEDA